MGKNSRKEMPDDKASESEDKNKDTNKEEDKQPSE